MRISDWSSDVCSSDLDTIEALRTRMDRLARKTPTVEAPRAATRGAHWITPKLVAEIAFTEFTPDGALQIGSASCRERVFQYVSISVVAVSLKKNHELLHTHQPMSNVHQSTTNN